MLLTFSQITILRVILRLIENEPKHTQKNKIRMQLLLNNRYGKLES